MRRPAVVMLLCILLGFVSGTWADHWAVRKTCATKQAEGANQGDEGEMNAEG